jgi:hypothetical protein
MTASLKVCAYGARKAESLINITVKMSNYWCFHTDRTDVNHRYRNTTEYNSIKAQGRTAQVVLGVQPNRPSAGSAGSGFGVISGRGVSATIRRRHSGYPRELLRLEGLDSLVMAHQYGIGRSTDLLD